MPKTSPKRAVAPSEPDPPAEPAAASTPARSAGKKGGPKRRGGKKGARKKGAAKRSAPTPPAAQAPKKLTGAALAADMKAHPDRYAEQYGIDPGEFDYRSVTRPVDDDLVAPLSDPNESEDDEEVDLAAATAARRNVPPASTPVPPGQRERRSREFDDGSVDAPGQAGAIPVDVFAQRRVAQSKRAAPASTYVAPNRPRLGRSSDMLSVDEADDEYSIALGAKRYVHPFSSFDWVTEMPDGGEPHKRRFTRCYVDEHVLMDIFPADVNLARVREEAAHVARQIAAHNVDADEGDVWGYIPIVAGAELTFEAAAVALKGRIAPFVNRELDPIGQEAS